MKHCPLILKNDQIKTNGVNGPVITYKLSPEEIQEKYGHIKPLKKEQDNVITAPKGRPIMFKSGGFLS